MKLRLSIVDYLNSAPLGWSFLRGPHRDSVEVVFSSPAGCADRLAMGEVDAGLIPSIEYQRIPGLRIVPGIAIAARKSVKSVLLVRPRRAGELRSLALDTSSRTSVALVQVLLRRRWGLAPELVPHPPDLPGMLEKCDAALIIGDAALRLEEGDYDILDLAEAWYEWQRKPFVFAFWACREEALRRDDLVALFTRARAWGLTMRSEIASDYARLLQLPEDGLREYLHRNIDYDMAAEHLEGLRVFYRLCHEEGLLDRLRPLDFLRVPSEMETVLP